MQIVISLGQGLHHLLCMFVPHPAWWDSLKPGSCLSGFLFISLLLCLTSVSPLSFPLAACFSNTAQFSECLIFLCACHTLLLSLYPLPPLVHLSPEAKFLPCFTFPSFLPACPSHRSPCTVVASPGSSMMHGHGVQVISTCIRR